MRSRPSQQRFGPLTYGTLLGTCVGLGVAAYGWYAIREGRVQRDYISLAVVAFGAATIGALDGIVADYLMRHPVVRQRRWIRHILGPVMFCTLPYLILAGSLGYFGYMRLWHGNGFWICVVAIPLMGTAVAVRRRFDPAYDQRYQGEATDDKES